MLASTALTSRWTGLGQRHLAFPFAIADPDARLEITGAVMRPEHDQLAGTCRDFYSVQMGRHEAEDDQPVAAPPAEVEL